MIPNPDDREADTIGPPDVEDRPGRAAMPAPLEGLIRELGGLGSDEAAKLDQNDLRAVEKATNALRHARQRRETGRCQWAESKKEPAGCGVSVRLFFGHRRKQSYKLRMLARDPRCVYCGKQLDEATATLDHVHPQCRGGRDEPGNLVLSCAKCNSVKDSRSAVAWAVDILRGAGVADPVGAVAQQFDRLPADDPTPFLIPFPSSTTEAVP